MLTDVHYHIDFASDLNKSIDFFKSLKKEYDINKISMLSVPTHADHVCRIENLRVLYAKDNLKPDCFAYFGLWYTGNDTSDSFLEQLKNGIKQGFDGVKLLETKPDIRKRIGYGIDSAIYDKFFDYLEEKGLPIIMHATDPEESWDIEKVDKWALEHGRFYGAEGFLTKEEIYAEVDRRLQKNPNLNLTLAHFYFLSADLSRAEQFLQKHPKIKFDLTPGKEMFINFGKDIEKSKAFFTKFADRLMFGTDVNNGDLNAMRYRKEVYDLVLKNLKDTEQFTLWGNTYTPLSLDNETVDQILNNTAEAWQGKAPKPNNRDEIVKEIMRVQKEYSALTDDEKKNFDDIKAYYNA